MRFFSSYRNRMRIRKIALTLLIVLLAAAALGIAVLIYLDRYIVYDQDGAHLRFKQEAAESESAAVSTVDAEIAYVSEDDEAAIGSSRKITGYYITGEMLRDVDALRAALAGKEYYALLFDMKDVYGNFYYPSTLSEASTAASVDAQAVSSLLSELRRSGTYLIARIPAFADQRRCLNHTDLGLPVSGGALWADSQNCYWMDPGNGDVINYLESICTELQAIGFREVLLDEFHFPVTDYIVYDESEKTKDEVLAAAAQTLQADMDALSLRVSFGVAADTAFPTLLTESRLYLTLEDGAAVAAAADLQEQSVVTPATQLVFLTASRDTRFDDYGSLAPLVEPDIPDEDS